MFVDKKYLIIDPDDGRVVTLLTISWREEGHFSTEKLNGHFELFEPGGHNRK